jgi:trehalose 2-sulfotransferase
MTRSHPGELDPGDRWTRREPNGYELTQVLAIASLPRTGSSVLSELLTASGKAGEPQEYLNYPRLAFARTQLGVPRSSTRNAVKQVIRMAVGRSPRWVDGVSRRSLRRYLDELAARTSTPNGVMSIKMHYGQFAKLEACGLSLSSLGVPVRWVRLDRRDRFAQAVSMVRARQTEVWSTVERPSNPVEPRYELDALRRAVLMLNRGAQRWDRCFERAGIEPLTLAYEEIAADLDAAVRAVLALVGEEPAELVAPRHQRMADGLSAEWIERLERDAADLAALRYAT